MDSSILPHHVCWQHVSQKCDQKVKQEKRVEATEKFVWCSLDDQNKFQTKRSLKITRLCSRLLKFDIERWMINSNPAVRRTCWAEFINFPTRWMYHEKLVNITEQDRSSRSLCGSVSIYRPAFGWRANGELNTHCIDNLCFSDVMLKDWYYRWKDFKLWPPLKAAGGRA